MPTLDWIGKRAVVNHHRELPYRLLHCDPALGAGDPASGNLLVEGDNLHALKALLPYYAGRVKCIYIDPPYNTGNEGWVYNDNVNAPEIQKWLGDTVGKEAEDLSRHDKWLCMMYPRLALLREFLTEDGVILISLDETEIGVLRVLMDEIFGKLNALGSIVWNTRNTDNRIKTHLSPDHEYLLVYGRSELSRIEGRIIDRGDFKNLDGDARGPYVTDPLTGKAIADDRPNLHAYNMVQPETGYTWKPDPAYGWITDEAGYKKLLAENRIWWPTSPTRGKPRKKRFLFETKTRMPASTFWMEFKTFSGARDLDDILGERVFAFPKPVPVVQRVIDYCAPPGSIILDSFAGSGTTGHAVLKQNAEDKGNRRFILIEMEAAIARNITRERVLRVAEGYQNAKGERVEGLGGGFRFCTLGEPIIDANGRFHPDVKWQDLAHHLWFAETGEPLPAGEGRFDPSNPLLGVAGDGRAIYLLPGGPDGASGSALTPHTLAALPAHDGPRVVYGEACTLRETTRSRERILFKQIPYQVRQQ